MPQFSRAWSSFPGHQKQLAQFMQMGCSAEWLQRDLVENCFVSQALLIACKLSERTCCTKGRIK